MRMIEDEARNRATYNAGDRYAHQDQRNRLRFFLLPKPIAQVEDHAGEISCLGEAERKTRDIKLICRLHEAGQGGNHAPCDQYSSYPDTSSNPMQDQIAGDLKQKV